MAASESGLIGASLATNFGSNGETLGMMNGSETSVDNVKNFIGDDMFVIVFLVGIFVVLCTRVRKKICNSNLCVD